jgi:nucleotide-binding universal stress UspA family protein
MFRKILVPTDGSALSEHAAAAAVALARGSGAEIVALSVAQQWDPSHAQSHDGTAAAQPDLPCGTRTVRGDEANRGTYTAAGARLFARARNSVSGRRRGRLIINAGGAGTLLEAYHVQANPSAD